MRPIFSFYTPGDFGRVLRFLHELPETSPYDACRFQFCMGYHVHARGMHGGFTRTCGLWEDEAGIVSLVMTEGGTGDAFLLFRSQEDKNAGLLLDMFEFAERFASEVAEDRKSNAYQLCIPDWDETLWSFAAGRGYSKTERRERVMIKDYPKEPAPVALPEGFVIRDARSFSPAMSALAHQHAFRYRQEDNGVVDAFTAIREMPDYRPELDLVVFDRNGQPAGLANWWINERVRLAELEPLGVVWWHRRKGLAAALIGEGINRTRALGCTRMYGGDQPFYWALGFEETAVSHYWSWTTPPPVSSEVRTGV